MKNFFVFVVSVEETGAGILKENACAVLSFGISKCLTLPEVEKKVEIGRIATGEASSFYERDKVLYVDKCKNPDIVTAVRTALCHDAQGVIIPFGNNKNRPYIREGRAFTTKEAATAVEEIKRLCPLFGRRFFDGSKEDF